MRASSWSRFFCRVIELVQLFCSLVSSSSFRRYSRWVSWGAGWESLRLTGKPLSLLGRGRGMDSPRTPWEGVIGKRGSQLCQPRDLPEAALSPKQARMWESSCKPRRPHGTPLSETD